MTTATENAIEVRGLRAAYGDNVILQNIGFSVRRGEVFVILGGSGCGKSTLMKFMIGLYRPTAGEILIGGEDIARAEGADYLRILRRFGVMYQSGALFGSLTVRENVKLPLDVFTRLPEQAKQMIVLLKLRLVGLEQAIDKLPSELSGGMIKRAAIARAMALDPEILFLDEPSAGLDPVSSASLDDLINYLSASLGITFVVVTHELPSIYAIADRVIMLDKNTKTIIAEGPPERLRDQDQNPLVRQFFNRKPAAGTIP
ncbi:MAG: ATP-binding cassette domain-containing protein [Verrucomicrobiae bacterium]|nr:ATP-binding cassette domain-containing protein [Verrucomicrobiae bacterium]